MTAPKYQPWNYQAFVDNAVLKYIEQQLNTLAANGQENTPKWNFYSIRRMHFLYKMEHLDKQAKIP